MDDCFACKLGEDGTIEFPNQIFEMPAWNIDPYDTEQLLHKLKLYLTFA